MPFSSRPAAVSSLSHLSRFTIRRTFIDAKIKWVRDSYLDAVVEREKNLKAALSLKHFILSSPSLSLPVSLASLQRHRLNLPTTALKFFQKYPSLFKIFQPRSSASRAHVKLSPQLLSLHKEERAIHESPTQRESAAMRLAKLMMLARACRIPLNIIDDLKYDLGLPDNYILDLVSYFPDYFRICDMKYGSNVVDSGANGGNFGHLEGRETFGLELIGWRKELAISAIERKALGDDYGSRRGVLIRFPLSFTPGFELQKKVKNWTEEWQCLPYISPYEDAFHLAPSSDQAEKWMVAVIHEILNLLVSKKTEMGNILRLGDYLGFGFRFKKALVHQPGMFHVSNKIKTQTVVLREAYRKDFLLEKHPLMGMRHRYIHLMNQSSKQKKAVKKLTARCNMWSAKDIEESTGVRSIEVY
ncbi:hypothetical protein Nepgr_016841 [Nepenthes gracilis]|uniref:PORR domain-containing protein n=1 Tax=Nepenthes gracilis TaxID=150966 RepID=A0AAD3XSV3_NEPGR|nr:hypothetical protein Nepgr_016841 [Nepenthes gracilis]